MKSNWLKVINFDEKYDFCYDNLGIVLNYFFQNFYFLGYDDNNDIIIKNCVNDKIFIVKKDNNKLKMNINYKDNYGIHKITKYLDLYRYNCLSNNVRQESVQMIYKSFEKLIYDDGMIDLDANRINLFDTVLFSSNKIDRLSSISFNSDILSSFDTNCLYGTPDLSFGTYIYRDNQTIASKGYYDNGIKYFSDYFNTNNSVAIAQIASDIMLDLYDNRKDKILKKEHKLRKIGFDI